MRKLVHLQSHGVRCRDNAGRGGGGKPRPLPQVVNQTILAPATAEERAFIEQGMGARATQILERRMAGRSSGEVSTMSFPVAAVAIAAATWCARGALASVPTSVLNNIYLGRVSGYRSYVWNAAIGCLAGEIGGWVWRWLPGWAKDRAVKTVIFFIIRYIR